MKKIITCLLMAAILISSISFSVFASEITDDVIIEKTLTNGTTVEVHSNPYVSDGITELEYRIIEKIRETATSIGFDINTDSSYQAYEEMIYKELFYCGNTAPISAEQLNHIYTIIENCGEMLKAKMEGKTPAEGTISEGFYAGATEEERDTIRNEVFRDYADEEIKKLGILNIHAGFGPYTAIFRMQSALFFRCNKSAVEGDNYMVEAIADVNQITYDSMASYFEGPYSMTEVKTYPENGKLISPITVGLECVGVLDEESYPDIFLLKYDGTVEKLNISSTEYFHGPSYLFDIDECGYIAYGTAKADYTAPTEAPSDTAPPSSTPQGLNNGKVTAPQTADSNNVFTLLVMSFISVTVYLFAKKRYCKH